MQGKPLGLSCCLILIVVVSAALASSGALAAPEISYVTRSADYGVPFVVMGEDLDKVSEVLIWSPGAADAEALKKAVPAGIPPLPQTPPSGAVKGEILNIANPHTMTVRGTESNLYVNWSVVPRVIWLKSGQVLSRPYLMNKPDLYFTSAPSVTAGEMLSIYGKDMGEASGAPAQGLILYRSLADGSVYWGRVLTTQHQGKPFRYLFCWDTQVPSDIPPGDYLVSINNLTGGAWGWSDTLPLKVAGRLTLVEAMSRPVANPGTSLAAIPEGSGEVRLEASSCPSSPAEFTSYLQARIDELSANSGGILTLPAGIYRIDATIRVKPRVVLRGAGRNGTELQAGALRRFRGEAMIEMASDTGLQDIGIVVGGGALDGVAVRPGPAPRPIFINRTCIVNMQTLNGPMAPRGINVIGRLDGFSMVGNEITAPGNILSARLGLGEASRYCYIQGNTFNGYPKNLNNCAFTLCSLADSVIENNEVKWHTRGLVNQQGMARCWVAANTLSEVGGIGNGCEVLLPEANNPYFAKSVVAAAAADITLSDTNLGTTTFKDHDIASRSLEYYVYVLAGRGMGQWRRAVDNEGTRLKLDEPWLVVPDRGSQVAVIAGISIHNLFINNRSLNNPGSVVLSWNDQVETSVVGNETYNGGPFYVFAGISDVSATSLHMYNYYADNRQIGSGGMDISTTRSRSYDYGKPPAFDNGNMFANIYVRNQLISPVITYSYNQYNNVWDYDYGREAALMVKNTDHNVFAGNYIYNAVAGISAENCVGNVFYANRMERLSGEALTLAGCASTTAVPYVGEPAYKPRILGLPSLPLKRGLFEAPGATPAHEVNLAKGLLVSTSFPPGTGMRSDRSVVTDGVTSLRSYLSSTNPGPQYIQLDLGRECEISRLRLWHYYASGRSYNDVIVQLSDTSDFSGRVVTLFNNDGDNSAGQGAGRDPAYFESQEGLDLRFKAQKARYVRCWLGGNNSNMHNHWIELMVFEAAR